MLKFLRKRRPFHRGDVIYAERNAYRHYGIYAGDDRVIHYAIHSSDLGLDIAVPILKDGAAHGIAVAYRVGGSERVYQSACLFSSAGDGVDRR